MDDPENSEEGSGRRPSRVASLRERLQSSPCSSAEAPRSGGASPRIGSEAGKDSPRQKRPSFIDAMTGWVLAGKLMPGSPRSQTSPNTANQSQTGADKLSVRLPGGQAMAARETLGLPPFERSPDSAAQMPPSPRISDEFRRRPSSGGAASAGGTTRPDSVEASPAPIHTRLALFSSEAPQSPTAARTLPSPRGSRPPISPRVHVPPCASSPVAVPDGSTSHLSPPGAVDEAPAMERQRCPPSPSPPPGFAASQVKQFLR